MREETKPW